MIGWRSDISSHLSLKRHLGLRCTCGSGMQQSAPLDTEGPDSSESYITATSLSSVGVFTLCNMASKSHQVQDFCNQYTIDTS